MREKKAETNPSRLTVRALRARAVSVPTEPPLQTSGGEIGFAPLVLIDLETEEGVTGRSYVFCYTPAALAPTARLVSNLEGLIEGGSASPLEIERKLGVAFRLLGAQGLTGMAMAGIDMAAWDALARAQGLPLVELLGGEARPVPAYGSLRRMASGEAAREAEDLAGMGFDTFKVKIGRSDVAEDLAVIRAIRSAVGEGAKLAVDYNQSLSVTEALGRIRVLEGERLYWIEEPTRHDDFAGHARIATDARTPICIGENWWGTHDMQKSLEAGASDHGMPDAMKIGGVTGWLRAAAMAEPVGMPLSSHIFPEVSAHLMNVTPTAHMLEYLDFAGAILEEPIRIEDGQAVAPAGAGIGLGWDEDAVARLLVG